MRIKNLGYKLMLCLTAIAAMNAAAFAAVSFANVGTNTPAANIQYAGGCVGPFVLNTNNAYVRSKLGFGFNPNVTVQISPLVGAAGCGSYAIAATGIWHLVMRDPNGNPSQFRVIDNASGNVVLQGTFNGAILHGRAGTSSLALTLMQDNVIYDPAHSPLLGGLGPVGGTFSIAILSQLPVPAGANGPAAFWANGDINFGAND